MVSLWSMVDGTMCDCATGDCALCDLPSGVFAFAVETAYEYSSSYSRNVFGLIHCTSFTIDNTTHLVRDINIIANLIVVSVVITLVIPSDSYYYK
jgi:hypothetical protein